MDAVLRRAEARRRLANAVLVHEVLRDREAFVFRRGGSRSSGTRTSSSVTSAWSLGMLKVHHMKSTRKPGVSVGTMKRGDAFGVARLAGGAREDHVVGRVVQAGVEALRRR